MVNHTHLNLAGALSGDMFVSGMLDSVVEVTQQTYWGKKQRQGFSIDLLCPPDVTDTLTSQCFTVTGTLPRKEGVEQVGEKSHRVKVSRRPKGYTTKDEMDDLLSAGLSQQEQASVRIQAQRLAIEQVENN